MDVQKFLILTKKNIMIPVVGVEPILQKKHFPSINLPTSLHKFFKHPVTIFHIFALLTPAFAVPSTKRNDRLHLAALVVAHD